MRHKKPINTATSSVWELLDRKSFLQNTANLERKALAWPSVFRVSTSASNASEDATGIKVDIEQQLADDFAFLAAEAAGANYVSAVSLELPSPGNDMTVRIAANEGVGVRVQEMFDGIFHELRRCANGSSRERCRDLCFKIVTDFHLNRILGRVGSVKYEPPAHEVMFRQKREPVPCVLKKLVDSLTPQQQAMLSFHDEVNMLWALYTELEKVSSDREKILSLARKIVVKVFDISHDGISFDAVLRTTGPNEPRVTPRVVEQVGKIANYWRICQTISEASRVYHNEFRAVRWATVTPYQPEVYSDGTQNKSKELFVHAEIQLVAYYATHKIVPQPRVIGVSKASCFLCNSLLENYAEFSVSKTHGVLFSQWTVPNLAEFDQNKREKLKACLLAVKNDVESATRKRFRDKGLRTCFPNQSLINKWIPSYSIASCPTISSVSNTSGDKTLKSSQVGSLAGKQTTSIVRDQSHSKSTDGEQARSSAVKTPNTELYTINEGQNACSRSDWMHLEFSFCPDRLEGLSYELSADESQSATSKNSSTFSKGEITVSSVPFDDEIGRGVQEISIADLQPGCALVLERHTGQQNLVFRIKESSGKAVDIDCRWRA